jgi:hypothetical protein
VTTELRFTTPTRAQALIAAGYRPVPVRGKQLAYAGDSVERDYAPEHFTDGTRIQVRAGLQKDGTYLYGADTEGPSHGPQYDAQAERAALETALPTIYRKLTIVPSTSGDGLWYLFRCYAKLTSGTLLRDGRKIGDFIGDGGTQRVPDFGDTPPQVLTKTELDTLLTYWTAANANSGDVRWTWYKREGRQLANGYQRRPMTRKQSVDFLLTHCGKPGYDLARALDSATRGERSDLAGSAMQTILFNIHKLTGWGASYTDKCRAAMAVWMPLDSFGKASDKNYDQEGDGYALLAKVLGGATKLSGDCFKIPFWAKSHPTPAANLHNNVKEVPTPTRPAHRPVGDQEKQLRKLRRRLEQWQFESAERIYYYVDDLADYLKVSRRTAQSYLQILETEEKAIARGQDGGRGGRAYLVLQPKFWGADNSEELPESPPDPVSPRGADESDDLPIVTPQSVDLTSQCIVDHQDLSAPTPGEAWYEPRADCIAGPSRWCGDNWTDPSAPRLRETPHEVGPPPPRRRRLHRAPGQAMFTRMDGDLYKRVAERPAGPLPAPTPYRHKLRMTEETLPDLPGAPAGVQGLGDPSLAAAAAEAPRPGTLASLKAGIQRYHERKAVQQ